MQSMEGELPWSQDIGQTKQGAYAHESGGAITTNTALTAMIHPTLSPLLPRVVLGGAAVRWAN